MRGEAILFILFIGSFVFSCSDQKEKFDETQKQTNSDKISEAKQLLFRNDTFSVVRIDKDRVFVSISDSLISNIKLIRSVISTVKLNYPFDRLRISFFSDAKYAGYKTEYINDSSAIRKWAYSYIGEFNSQEKEFWTYPLFPDLKTKYIIQ